MPRRPAVTRLPAAVKAWLDQALVEGNFSGYEALAAELEHRGYRIGKSSLHRYGQYLQRQQEGLKALAEASKAFVGAVSDDAASINDMLLALTQQKLFELMRALEDAEVSPAEIAKITRAIADVSRATVTQKRFAADVRRRLEAKMDEIEGEARRGTRQLDPATLAYVREHIYGVV